MLVSSRNLLLARSLTDIVNYSYKIGRLTKVISRIRSCRNGYNGILTLILAGFFTIRRQGHPTRI